MKRKFAPSKTHHEIHSSPPTATTSRRRTKNHVPRVSPCSPASIDTGFVEIGLVQLSHRPCLIIIMYTSTRYVFFSSYLKKRIYFPQQLRVYYFQYKAVCYAIFFLVQKWALFTTGKKYNLMRLKTEQIFITFFFSNLGR